MSYEIRIPGTSRPVTQVTGNSLAALRAGIDRFYATGAKTVEIYERESNLREWTLTRRVRKVDPAIWSAATGDVTEPSR